MRLLVFFALIGAALGIAAPGTAEAQIAVLQGLDKVTARISTMDAPIGRAIRFGTLTITARHCSKTPPEELPEVKIYLEIVEVRPGEVPIPLFRGWMFGSSPAVSALEHPVYDVWAIDCRTS